MNQRSLDNSERHCVFCSDDQWFAVPAMVVRTIVPCPDLSPVPFSDPILVGVSQIQNEFIPIVSLRALTQIQYESAPSHEQQVMVFNGPAGPWGLLVDRAVALATLEMSIASYSGDQDRWARAVLGSASYQQHVLQVLDPDAVFEYAHQLIDGFWENSGLSALQLN